MTGRAAITSTYRLQLRTPTSDPDGRGRTFADAAALLPYLDELGVSHLYLSPILTATTGSTHGYDVTDPSTISAELGGREGFAQLVGAARRRGIGVVIDIVPNHLGIANPRENHWWWDVLRLGADSPYAGHFDLDLSADNGAGGKIALPVLGDRRAMAELTVDRDGDEPMLAYHEHRFPIRPGTDAGTAPQIHERQAYRLVDWRSGLIGYRRFFSVDGLAGIRQEDPRVFTDSHAAIAELVAADLIDGVRVDHPDGLADPAGYLARLRDLIGPDRWLVIEKILAVDEPLDPRLPVDGTTGYDALRELDGVFIERSGAGPLGSLARDRTGSTGDARDLHATEYALQREVAGGGLAAEIRRLGRAVRRDAWTTASPGVGDDELELTLVDLVASIPVYRADYRSLSRLTAGVVAEMATRRPDSAPALDLIAAALVARGEAATRFAQVCGAVMAKGVEDCTFYRRARLVSLQEVGGDPGRFGVSAAEFHLAQAERAELWPAAMTTLSTHDTKRGEDVRARIGVLSQIPDLWARQVATWSAALDRVDPATELFLWQNLIGIWPADRQADPVALRERFHAYATKATREAGVRTTWTEPDEAFEDAIHAWIDAILDGPCAASVGAFVRRIDAHGRVVSLGTKLLQLAGPGVPDVYQGTELWDDSLVDPDNRRFVDHDVRRVALARLSTVGAPEGAPIPAAADPSGDAKLVVVSRTLRLRRERPASFVGGTYAPVFASGPAAPHLVGFARGPRGATPDVIAVATRRSVALAARGWENTDLTLPEGTWTDRLTGRTHTGTVPVTELFADLPVALLVL